MPASIRRKSPRYGLDLDLSVSYSLPRAGLPAPASFRRWAEATLRGRMRRADLAIRLANDHEAQALNRHYRGRDYATNVLSFPAELPEGVKLPVLGDIVLCPSVVAKEAAEQKKTLRNHYAHLTVHGVLHLLGFDHIDKKEALAMETLECEVLDGLGIADPYTVIE